MYKTIIIGMGPAGVSAAVYAARKHMKTALIGYEWGGQSIVSPDIQNWVGTPHISGASLAKSLQTHAEEYKGEYLDIVTGDRVIRVEKIADYHFKVHTKKGQVFETETVLVATGSGRRKITVPGATEYENKGIVYCASCDGPLYRGEPVVVLGGGNAAFETVLQLAAYCSSVTLLHRSDTFRADAETVEKVAIKENVHIITHANLSEVYGDGNFVTGVRYKKDDVVVDEKAIGVFVEIGQIPNTDFIKDIVVLNTFGKITIDPWTGRTSAAGIWAAGDCTNILYHQNNIAAGEGVKALEDLFLVRG
jgi:NADH-dependent peroxiredoxin subunit F